MTVSPSPYDVPPTTTGRLLSDTIENSVPARVAPPCGEGRPVSPSTFWTDTPPLTTCSGTVACTAIPCPSSARATAGANADAIVSNRVGGSWSDPRGMASSVPGFPGASPTPTVSPSRSTATSHTVSLRR